MSSNAKPQTSVLIAEENSSAGSTRVAPGAAALKAPFGPDPEVAVGPALRAEDELVGEPFRLADDLQDARLRRAPEACRAAERTDPEVPSPPVSLTEKTHCDGRPSLSAEVPHEVSPEAREAADVGADPDVLLPVLEGAVDDVRREAVLGAPASKATEPGRLRKSPESVVAT